jgi:membrane-bound lytic murein transglycosylase C
MNLSAFANLGVVLTCALSLSLSAQESHLMVKPNAQYAASDNVQLSQEQAEFKRQYEAEFSQFKSKYLDEFAAFKAQYNKELSKFRADKLGQWGEVETSSKTKVVSYPEENVKAVVDFETEQISISILHDENQSADPEKAALALTQLQSVNVNPTVSETANILQNLMSNESLESLLADPVKSVNSAKKDSIKPQIDESDFAIEKAFAEELLDRDMQSLDILGDSHEVDAKEINKLKNALRNKNRSQSRSQAAAVVKQRNANSEALKSKRITRFTIPVKGKSENEKLQSVRPFVGEYAEKWQLPTELVVAIIHTESNFNPDAVSNVPAYGLMQIAPVTTGVPINEFLYKKRTPMDKAILFKANKNIEAGTAYFYLLLNRHMKQIQNPTSRLYCAIAAYNTGIGNVAATFHADKQRHFDESTLAQINAMAPEQVLDILLDNLPYEETKKYLRTVKKRMAYYRKFV